MDFSTSTCTTVTGWLSNGYGSDGCAVCGLLSQVNSKQNTNDIGLLHQSDIMNMSTHFTLSCCRHCALFLFGVSTLLFNIQGKNFLVQPRFQVC